MNKLSLAGFISFVTGLTMIVFKSISSLTGVEMKFPDSTIESLVSPDKLAWIDTLSQDFVYNTALTLVTTPIYIYCIAIGVVLLVASGLMGK